MFIPFILTLAVSVCANAPCVQETPPTVSPALERVAPVTVSRRTLMEQGERGFTSSHMPSTVSVPAQTMDRGSMVEVVKEGEDHIFSVFVRIQNLNTQETHLIQTEIKQRPVFLVPGTYRVFTESSRYAFPQEAKYQVVDTVSGRVVESFPKSHVPVNAIVLEKGQHLRVILVPSIRSYNAVFYRIGAEKTPAAHRFARPYPTMDSEPGAFNGPEQFPSAQTSIVFWGTRRSMLNPEQAARIRSEGVSGVRAGTAGRVFDPVIVLGVRTVAEDLARVFVSKRHLHLEDYRGAHHTNFLIQRTSRGRVPRSLLRMSEAELAHEFEKQLLWMETHNVHRPTEGSGYGNESFMDVLQKQATEEMRAWPETSRKSTEMYRQYASEMTSVMNTSGESGTVSFEGKSVRVGDALPEVMRRLVLATRRERMNYDTYDPSSLQEVTQALGTSIVARRQELNTIEQNALQWLKQTRPSIAADLQ